MAYYGAPAQDINAKYNTANAELNQLYTLATSALPVAPDAVIQALITCRMALTGLMPGQAQPMPVLSMAPPPEPDPMAVPPPPQQQQMPLQQQQMGEQQMYAPQQQMYAPQMGGMSYHPSAMSGHVHGGGPPPPPPAVLMPQGTYHAPPPPPAEQANFTRRADNWPPRSYHKSLGEAIHQAQECPGHVRHEIIIEKRCIGRILGKGGRDLAAMKEGSGSEVFIIDKEPPPGTDEDHRMLILVGTPDNVNSCLITVNKTLERARNELPPLPPPLSSGWRPVPSASAEVGWSQDGNNKRSYDEYQQ